MIALIERDPDLAIFQILRQEGGQHTAYGVRRSLNCAITAFLVAQRLGWDGNAIELAFKVALTMNLSMLELQGQPLTVALALLTLIAGLLPAGVAYVGAHIVDAVVHAVDVRTRHTAAPARGRPPRAVAGQPHPGPACGPACRPARRCRRRRARPGAARAGWK